MLSVEVAHKPTCHRSNAAICWRSQFAGQPFVERIVACTAVVQAFFVSPGRVPFLVIGAMSVRSGGVTSQKCVEVCPADQPPPPGLHRLELAGAKQVEDQLPADAQQIGSLIRTEGQARPARSGHRNA